MNNKTPRGGARRRHWLIDAVAGSAAAVLVVSAAHSSAPPPRSAAGLAADRAAAAAPARPVQAAPLIAFVEPVPGHGVVSPFGLRKMPWEAGGRLHAGIDIAANRGEPVLASADGVVTEAGNSPSYGRYVAVRHAEGLTSFYAHLGAIEAGVVAGLALKAGAEIGRIGSSGSSTGPHLHFEIRDQRDRPLNPSLFLGRAFADAADLPLGRAQRFGGRVRIAHVSRIPAGKRALMQARLERGAASDAAAMASDVSSIERIEGLKDIHFGDDGRPHATLSF